MGFVSNLFGGGGGGKQTTTQSVQPWVPGQGQFNDFIGRGQQLMSPQFRQGIERAQDSVNAAQAQLGTNPIYYNTALNQAVGGLMDPRFSSVTGQNAPMSNILSGAVSGAQRPQYAQGFQGTIAGAQRPQYAQGFQQAISRAQAPQYAQGFQQAISGAQTPQYAQGVQETWQEMLDPTRRSEAFNQVRQNVANDVMSNINTTFGGAGMSGSTLHQQNLAKGLTSGLANVENQAFQQALDRALQTAGIAQSDLQNQRQFGLSAAQAGQQDLQNQRAFGLGAAQAGQADLMAQRGLGLNAAQIGQGALQAQREFGLGAAQAGQNALSNQFAQNLQAAQARQGAFESGRERQMQGARALQDAQNQRFGQNLAIAQQRAGLGGQYQDVYGGNILNLMNAATGNAAETTSERYQPGFLDYAEAGLNILSLIPGAGFSDRRLKQDVKRVGALDDGTPVYSYRYLDVPELGLSSTQTHIGVMSDEVDQSLVVKDQSGFDRVNYGAI